MEQAQRAHMGLVRAEVPRGAGGLAVTLICAGSALGTYAAGMELTRSLRRMSTSSEESMRRPSASKSKR